MPPLEPKLKDSTYTLVLDLDETLIHYYEENGKEKYRERPGAYEFIQKMAEHYELVIFTAGLQDVIPSYLTLNFTLPSTQIGFSRALTKNETT